MANDLPPKKRTFNYVLIFALFSNCSIDGIRYTITQNSGKKFTGTLNKEGVGEKYQTEEAGVSSVEYEFPEGKPEEPQAPIEVLSS